MTEVIDPHSASEGEEQVPETMASVLQTEDEQEQIEMVKQLLMTRPATIVASINPVTGNMTVLANQDMSYKQLHGLLDMAGDALHDREKQSLLANQAREMMQKQMAAKKTPEANEEAEESNEVEV